MLRQVITCDLCLETVVVPQTRYPAHPAVAARERLRRKGWAVEVANAVTRKRGTHDYCPLCRIEAAREF